ncbi:hypothetical protein [Streptomyces achromogenes]|uniref:Uncharacterized protein n=1 Tax=Streptomyces achromogenes TaxID=67255 RepID=A0ABZ1KFZ3_STRAH|nr:hypothetical protein [Streptomyces achromogenes]MCZ0209702.1 hypothetical protein [Streptomyces sp. UMAF16]
MTTSTTTTPVPLDLTALADNVGVTRPDRLSEGAFNIWGNTFPAEELPPAGTVEVHGIPFRWPATGDGSPDNVRCRGQLVTVPEGRYDWIHVLAAAERRTEDPLLLHFADGSVDPEWLRVSDFWPETASRFGERPAFSCTRLHYPRHIQHAMGPTVWRQRVPVTREERLRAFRLPDNPAMHLFAITLAPAVRPEATQ